MTFGCEHHASRAGRDDLGVGALEYRRGIDDYNIVFGRCGLDHVAEGKMAEEFLRVRGRRAGTHHRQAAETQHLGGYLVESLTPLEKIDESVLGRESEQPVLRRRAQIGI